jgi:hypothetical protein
MRRRYPRPVRRSTELPNSHVHASGYELVGLGGRLQAAHHVDREELLEETGQASLRELGFGDLDGRDGERSQAQATGSAVLAAQVIAGQGSFW